MESPQHYACEREDGAITQVDGLTFAENPPDTYYSLSFIIFWSSDTCPVWHSAAKLSTEFTKMFTDEGNDAHLLSKKLSHIDSENQITASLKLKKPVDFTSSHYSFIT